MSLSSSADVKESVVVAGEVFTKDLSEFGGIEGRKQLERKLLWKIDLRMSILVLIYVLNYIDRNNAGAARLHGFEADLHLKGQEFATLLSILYVGYIIMQIPSNMLLNWMGKPSWYLPLCMMIWGMLSILTGMTLPFNFLGALLTRFFLGFVEAAFFPGALFLLSKWYTRKELGLRTAILYCGNIMSNAFGGLLAAGILSGMDGKLGQAGWRWLFFIEGSLTVFVAICAIFILPDFPATMKSLSPLERKLALLRMAEDVGEGDEEDKGEEHNQWTGLTLAVTDWKVWWLAFALLSQVLSLSFNAYFPTLTATLGFKSTTITLLLTVPPWFFATFVSFFNARHADVTGERFWHISGPILLGIVGFVISLSTMNTAARYIALFLEAQSYAGFIVLYTWLSNSFARPPAKRAVALALINAWSQLGNIAGSYIWASAWGPTYRKSYGVCVAAAGLTIAMCYVFRQHLIQLNRKLDRKEQTIGRKITFRYLY
ncbi:MFS general substrate transporter [Hysterangium stoloniferum]|nr:MFS general substrate transporter [Hysterangium stoloniferum]